MSRAQLTQLAITLAGIVVAVTVFVAGPFSLLVNGVLAFVIFVIAGAAAGYAYARLASQAEKIADLRDRVDNPPS